MQCTSSIYSTPHKDEYRQLIAVWEASVRATHDFMPDSYISMLRSLLLSRYLGAVTLFCTRDAQMNITGFAGVSLGKLEMLFVDPVHHGKGLGKQLLAHSIENYGISELDVNEQNPKALRFYRRQGFEIISRTEVDGLGQPYPMLRMRLKQH